LKDVNFGCGPVSFMRCLVTAPAKSTLVNASWLITTDEGKFWWISNRSRFCPVTRRYGIGMVYQPFTLILHDGTRKPGDLQSKVGTSYRLREEEDQCSVYGEMP